jgi:4-amino-4-deoxy-L-arabinose transferase-like glycosyltransferase
MSETGFLTGVPGTVRGKALLLWCVAAAGIAAIVLAANAPLYNIGQLHTKFMYVDQAGYILSARILAATGELKNGVVFPAQIDNPDFYVHMPGHVVALATSYRLLGWGIFQTLLPSMLAYIAGAVGVFQIGNRLYGSRAGLLAATLFALFPANIAYGFTAMAELTFTCACILALVIFVHVGRRLLPFAPPILLALPFLFRETGAFLIIPMALCVLHVRGWRSAAGASLGSVVTLWTLNRWQIASGKVAASLAWVTEGSFNYGNAFAEPPPALTMGGWLAALGDNIGLNLRHLQGHVSQFPGELMPWALYGVALVLLPVLWIGIARRKRDPFALGAGLLMVFVAVLAVTVYDAKAHKLLRTMMYTFPFGAIVLSGALLPSRDDALASRNDTRTGRLPIGAMLLLVAALGASLQVSRLAARTMTRQDALTLRNTSELAKLHGTGMIVAGNLAAPLATEGYPDVRWCLAPENEETLELVLGRYDVQTIVVFKPLTPEFVTSHGLRMTHRQRIGLRWHTFYQPAP